MNTENVSTKIMASYGSGKFLTEFIMQAFGVVVFKFYETVIFEDAYAWLPTLAFVIYSVYNAFNDPLIGYITEKKTTRFSAKYGRRFPWIFIGSLLWVFSYVLIFAVPGGLTSDPYITFIWMVLTVCLFDTLYSLWDVNYQSIFPDKFRSENVRQRTIAVGTAVGVVGIALGFLIPSGLADINVIEPYLINSILIASVAFFVVFILIPGTRETPEMIERYIEDRKKKGEESFFSELINALKERNFTAWIILYFFYQSGTVSFTASILYVGDYILPEGEGTTIIFVGLLAGALIAIPIWQRINSRVIQNNQRTLMIAAIVMALFILPITLPQINNSFGFTLFVFLGGLGFGGYWMIMTPALADVIDEIVVKTGKRNDGIFMGFRAFFGRFAFAVQAISFWLVHEITGFNADIETQSESAILGIHIHMALLPAIFLLIGVFIFWRLNDLNSEKVGRIKTELKDLGL
ncbi:MAG: MFS transporter [Candidatus Heimdallarchaeota archaeon]|nr:MAG: MFS transporter [Candidatus Heimdallarchaeota archaeon]